MQDSEFFEYVKHEWSFLRHPEGIWGGTDEMPLISIDSMTERHLLNAIAMVEKWQVRTKLEDEADRERLKKLKQKKLDELNSALKRKQA